MSAQSVIDSLRQCLRNLEFDLELSDLTDGEYCRRLEDDGFDTSGRRWSRIEIEQWINRINRLLRNCEGRRDDSTFFDTVFWFGVMKSVEGFERLKRWEPLIEKGRREHNRGQNAGNSTGNQDRRAKWPTYQKAVDEVVREHPDWTHHRIAKHVEKFRKLAGYRTIYDRTESPNKRNNGNP